MSQEVLSRSKLPGEKAVIIYFVIAKLILCLFPFEYGFFPGRTILYCAKR